MVTALILTVPNFQEEIFSWNLYFKHRGWCCIDAKCHHIAFISEALAPKHHGFYAYEKAQMVVVYVIKKWTPYSIGRHLPINDHCSLKHLLEQKISTSFYSRWLYKQLGLDCQILFRKGSENSAADAVHRAL